MNITIVKSIGTSGHSSPATKRSIVKRYLAGRIFKVVIARDTHRTRGGDPAPKRRAQPLPSPNKPRRQRTSVPSLTAGSTCLRSSLGVRPGSPDRQPKGSHPRASKLANQQSPPRLLPSVGLPSRGTSSHHACVPDPPETRSNPCCASRLSVPSPTAARMAKRQCARALRVRRRIQRRHRASLMRSQNDRTRRTDSIEHRSQVLHAGFKGRKMGAIIRKPRPTLIEQDQTKRAGKTLVKLTPIPRLPPVHQIRHVIEAIHEVHLAGTDDLVRVATLPRRAYRISPSTTSIFPESDHTNKPVGPSTGPLPPLFVSSQRRA